MVKRIVNKMSETSLIDCDTGEVLDTAYIGDQIRIIRRESIENFRRISESSVEANKGREFVKQFPDISDRLCSALTPYEFWLFSLLIPYVGVNSGILKFRNGIFVQRRSLLEVVDNRISRAMVDKCMNGLVSKGILAKCQIRDKKCYIMNPYVCHKGSKANETLLTLFKDSGWEG